MAATDASSPGRQYRHERQANQVGDDANEKGECPAFTKADVAVGELARAHAPE